MRRAHLFLVLALCVLLADAIKLSITPKEAQQAAKKKAAAKAAAAAATPPPGPAAPTVAPAPPTLLTAAGAGGGVAPATVAPVQQTTAPPAAGTLGAGLVSAPAVAPAQTFTPVAAPAYTPVATPALNPVATPAFGVLAAPLPQLQAGGFSPFGAVPAAPAPPPASQIAPGQAPKQAASPFSKLTQMAKAPLNSMAQTAKKMLGLAPSSTTVGNVYGTLKKALSALGGASGLSGGGFWPGTGGRRSATGTTGMVAPTATGRATATGTGAPSTSNGGGGGGGGGAGGDGGGGGGGGGGGSDSSSSTTPTDEQPCILVCTAPTTPCGNQCAAAGTTCTAPSTEKGACTETDERLTRLGDPRQCTTACPDAAALTAAVASQKPCESLVSDRTAVCKAVCTNGDVFKGVCSNSATGASGMPAVGGTGLRVTAPSALNAVANAVNTLNRVSSAAVPGAPAMFGAGVPPQQARRAQLPAVRAPASSQAGYLRAPVLQF